MQNKANSQRAQMNVSIFSKIGYENKSDWTLGENKANSKPIKACPERSRMGQFPASGPVKSSTKKWVFSQRRPVALGRWKIKPRSAIIGGG